MKIELVNDGLGNIVGSAVIVVFGLLVLLPRPRSRAQWSFAAFALSIGVATAASNIEFSAPAWPTDLMWVLLGVGHVIALAGLFGFVGATMGRSSMRSWRLLAPFFLILVGIMTLGFWRPGQVLPANVAVGLPETKALIPGIFLAIVFFAAAWTAALALARWARNQPADERVRAAILSSALVLYPTAVGTYGTGLDHLLWIALDLGTMLAAATLCLAWLATARTGPARRAAIIAALLPPLAVTVAMWLAADGLRWTAGVSRILMTGLAAFAILRYHAFGIHARLRFGISKSAVAAVFVGVFFAVSELAQQFFGERSGNEYYGIAAAGLLVVAIAPLQRLADRLAAKAVPIQNPAVDRMVQEEIFHEAVQAASRDGVVTRREEVHLARIADRLGIGAERALQLRGPDVGDGRRNRR